MKIKFFSATPDNKDTFEKGLLGSSLDGLFEKEVIFENTDGLGTVYNKAIVETDADILVLCHDDVSIQHPELLAAQLAEAMGRFDIVGLAGLQKVESFSKAAWHLMGSKLSGEVSHTKDGKTWKTYFGETPAEVAIIDGLFIALKMSSIRKVGLRFDEKFKFHHYDLDLCLQAGKLGLKIGTWPISVVHAGLGDSMFSLAWEDSRKAFLAKWDHHPNPLILPFVAMEPKNGERPQRDPNALLKIAYFTTDNGGCSYYRSMLPLDTAYALKLANVMRVEKGASPDRAGDAFSGADVVTFPRIAAGLQMLAIISELKKDGKLVAADYDDNIWAVSPLSHHYQDYGTEEYTHTLVDGREMPVWRDGDKGFSIKRNRERLDQVAQALAMVDLVTTTTEPLAAVLRQYSRYVEVLPNAVDMNRWKPIALKPHDEFRLFWAGGASHFEDWNVLRPVLPTLMAQYPQVKLVLMGAKFDWILSDIPATRIEFHPWEDNLSYPYKCAMLGADLAIIPLIDNEFNRSKSALKLLEQSALGVPSVVSNVGPYADAYNGLNAVMVNDNDPGAWLSAISTMIEQPLLRARIAGDAQRWAEGYDIKKRAQDWVNVYRNHLLQKELPCLSHSQATS